MRVAARAAVAVAMLCGCAAAAEPALEYEITEAGAGRGLFTAWGWTEATDAGPDSVAVLSRTVFPQGSEALVRAVWSVRRIGCDGGRVLKALTRQAWRVNTVWNHIKGERPTA